MKKLLLISVFLMTNGLVEAMKKPQPPLKTAINFQTYNAATESLLSAENRTTEAGIEFAKRSLLIPLLSNKCIELRTPNNSTYILEGEFLNDPRIMPDSEPFNTPNFLLVKQQYKDTFENQTIGTDNDKRIAQVTFSEPTEYIHYENWFVLKKSSKYTCTIIGLFNKPLRRLCIESVPATTTSTFNDQSWCDASNSIRSSRDYETPGTLTWNKKGIQIGVASGITILVGSLAVAHKYNLLSCLKFW